MKKPQITLLKKQWKGENTAYLGHVTLRKRGTMLPCNVIVQQISETQTEIAAVDPVASMQAIENNKLAGIAKEIRSKLEQVIIKT